MTNLLNVEKNLKLNKFRNRLIKLNYNKKSIY